MEPITIASSFASIVGLINQFLNQIKKDKASSEDFLKWLQETDNVTVKKQLEKNNKALESLVLIFNEDLELLKEKLRYLDNAFALFASKVDSFSNLVESIKPNSILSDQAVNILKMINDSSGSKIIKLDISTGTELVSLDGEIKENLIIEKRFLEDDLKTLVELNLLRLDYNSQGDEIYIFTRTAFALLASIKKE